MCDYCERHKKIALHRAENLNVHDCYIIKADDGTAMIFENVQGMPAHIDVDYCFHCGEPLTEPKPLSLDELRVREAGVWLICHHWQGYALPCYSPLDERINFMCRTIDGVISRHIEDYNNPESKWNFFCYDRQPQKEENI